MSRRALPICAGIIIVVWSALSAAQDPAWPARLKEAFAWVQQGRAADASAVFDDVAAAALAAGDWSWWAEARRGQGRVLDARLDYAGALAAYDEALKAFEQAGNLAGAGKVHSDRAFVAYEKAEWDTVRTEYERAAAAYEAAGLKSEHASALRNMTFGRIPVAERIVILRRALTIARDGEDRAVEGLILHQLGDMLFSTGELQASLDCYDAALPLLELRQGSALAGLLTSLGRHHRVHGDPDNALPYYVRALELQRAAGDLRGMSQTEDAIAIALAVLRRLPDALEHAERSVQLATEAHASDALVASRRVRVAEMAVRLGRFDRALELIEATPQVPASQVRWLVARAQALALRGDLDAAVADVTAAVTMTAGQANWEQAYSALLNRSDILDRAGHLPEALADALAAVSVIEGVRGRLVQSDDYRVAFSGGYRLVYDRAVDLLSRAARHQEAFEMAERGRARALLDLRLARSAGADESSGGAASSPPRLQATAVTGDDTLIAYWVSTTATHAWVVREGKVTTAERLTIGRSELSALVDKAAAFQPGRAAGPAITTRGPTQTRFDNDPRPSLRALHDRLVAPLRASLPATAGARLLIVPDGPLLGLSFAELVSPAARYLLEDYTLQYAPSVALFAGAGSRSPAPHRAEALLVAVSSGFPKASGEVLAPLPGAYREVNALAKLFRPQEATIVSQAAATEARVREAMARSGVVHLATHAVVSSREPAESFLALRASGSDDGRLTAGEIIGLSLDAKLVVLSACRGAAGQVAGEGMLGLSRALLGAGAHALLASVRDLPDEAAAEILPRFYASWRKSGDAAAALRQAQLAQLQRLRAGRVRIETAFGPVTLPEHPSLWAGFVLIGER